jgi:hypothetical protein
MSGNHLPKTGDGESIPILAIAEPAGFLASTSKFSVSLAASLSITKSKKVQKKALKKKLLFQLAESR